MVQRSMTTAHPHTLTCSISQIKLVQDASKNRLPAGNKVVVSLQRGGKSVSSGVIKLVNGSGGVVCSSSIVQYVAGAVDDSNNNVIRQIPPLALDINLHKISDGENSSSADDFGSDDNSYER